MKRQGFTLVELLAVIVILAIIALISTPTILGVIEKARKGSAEQSALGYIDAVEKQIAINQVKGEKLISDGTYDVPMEEVTVKGEVPTKGWLKIEKGLVTEYSFIIGKYVVTKNEETKKGDTPKTYNVYSNGTAIYYNPETNKECSSSESKSTTGTKTGCMKWYTFNDEGDKSSTVNMILDHNTTATIPWITKEDYIKAGGTEEEYGENGNNNRGGITANNQLKEDTQSWSSDLNARLITANEVAKITGNTSFNEKSSTGDDWFCLDTNNKDTQSYCKKSKGTSKYKWLFDYTNTCTNNGCDYDDTSTWEYWTNSVTFDNIRVWAVNRKGTLENSRVILTITGIRPVITVTKSIIS